MHVRKFGIRSRLVIIAAAILTAAATQPASAVPFSIDVSGSVGMAYFGTTPFANYSATGTIEGDLGTTTMTVTGGSLNLTGTGPDSVMTFLPGVFTITGTGISDFGQGPFDVGVPPENPAYVFDTTGSTGLLGDVFGSIVLGGGFDAEGFGLAAAGSPTHSMSYFFLSGTAQEVVPEPGTAVLLGLGLVGLASRRKAARSSQGASRALMNGLCALFVLGGSSYAHATPVTVVEAGELIGFDGIVVSNQTYDVRFVDGSFYSIFGDETGLDFTTSSDAGDAATALMNAFNLFPVYDYTPSLTRGLTSSQSGDIFTPYRLGNNVGSRNFHNVAQSNDHSDAVTGSVGMIPTYDSSPGNNFSAGRVWADWSVSSATVPEPSTATLLGLGLAGIGVVRKRKPELREHRNT